ncbi:hypothetical protein ACSNOI_07450 [Actinomadura kijaniata]|uniref:hypothetical protein n=1 Tax=Actinomadura kijaniata TaxID=46161 RepID=UPI003F1B6D24
MPSNGPCRLLTTTASASPAQQHEAEALSDNAAVEMNAVRLACGKTMDSWAFPAAEDLDRAVHGGAPAHTQQHIPVRPDLSGDLRWRQPRACERRANPRLHGPNAEFRWTGHGIGSSA